MINAKSTVDNGLEMNTIRRTMGVFLGSFEYLAVLKNPQKYYPLLSNPNKQHFTCKRRYSQEPRHSFHIKTNLANTNFNNTK